MGSFGNARLERVRALNDNLRRFHIGGQVMLSSGLAALPWNQIEGVVKAVAAFDAFGQENDPYGEHDCASLDAEGQRVMWKIDYYDPSMTQHSEDESDPKKTKRVMTIMLADEY